MNPYLNSMNGFGGGFIAFWPNGEAGEPEPTPVTGPRGLHGGGGGQLPWNGNDWYPKKKPVVDPKEQERIARIMREDQEILDFIITFVTKGQTE